ncbi:MULTISPECIES: hypothetical protein [Haloferax]|uniref:Uncharacterized protein n=1 Tax=Haloferax marinum TaxID=2666143 RepID=A0A6A8G6P1_9EURY|nr:MULTISPECIES: hypothetical protein [Haloferax]KAB1197195.1 hypothetical protein Hfx1150_06555 [Haloferax sp. CBA1150]MRW96232.1 hypothetical protein [Haloferax marinum]
MAADGFVFVLFFALAVGVPVVLYWAMQQETENLPTMDRKEAERRAREEGARYNQSSRRRE